MRTPIYTPEAGDAVRVLAVYKDASYERCAKYVGRTAKVIRAHDTMPDGADLMDGFMALVLEFDDNDVQFFYGVRVEPDPTVQEDADAMRELADQLSIEDQGVEA